jgi:hypothetical protein
MLVRANSGQKNDFEIFMTDSVAHADSYVRDAGLLVFPSRIVPFMEYEYCDGFFL